MKPVRFTKSARDELDSAVAHYNREHPGLGARFLQHVKQARNRVQKYPTMHPPAGNDCRKCRILKFPFGLIYREREQEIQIVALMHVKQKPDYWRGRL